MDWQLLPVIFIVAACGYFAFREIRNEFFGGCKCPGCPESHRSKKIVSIEPPNES